MITFYDAAREKAPTFPFTVNLKRWSLANPERTTASSEEKREMFRHVRDQIKDCIGEFLTEFDRRESGQKWQSR